MIFSKKDVWLATILGFLVAALAQIIIVNLDFILPFELNRYWLLVILPVLSPLGLYASFKIAQIWRPFVFQFGKFFVVGGLNTFLDLGILNLFISVTDITHGLMFSVFKSISFIAAVVNSYFWNKLWTFESRTGSFLVFFIVTFIGFLINVGVASLMVNVIGSPSGVSAKAWDNIAALSSVVFVLTWNFSALKFIVFRKK